MWEHRGERQENGSQGGLLRGGRESWALAHKEWASLNRDLLERRAAKKDIACAEAQGTRHENVRRVLEVPVELECVGSTYPGRPWAEWRAGHRSSPGRPEHLGRDGVEDRISAQREDAVTEMAQGLLETESGAKEGPSKGI